MANFRTEGRITTQSALSRTLCGILSGALRISFITLPAFSTRSCSLSCAKAGNANARAKLRPSNIFFMVCPQCLCAREARSCSVLIQGSAEVYSTLSRPSSMACTFPHRYRNEPLPGYIVGKLSEVVEIYDQHGDVIRLTLSTRLLRPATQ